jgi:hypothetical protein
MKHHGTVKRGKERRGVIEEVNVIQVYHIPTNLILKCEK